MCKFVFTSYFDPFLRLIAAGAGGEGGVEDVFRIGTFFTIPGPEVGSTAIARLGHFTLHHPAERS